MSRRHRSALKVNADMNLTSMMDLTFLLLITFIITFPLIEQGLPITLPKGKAQTLEADDKPAVVTVDKQNRIYIGQTIVTLDDLNTRLRAMLTENKQLRLVIRGDKDVNYGAIVDVARLATDIGITKMALATSAPD